MIIRWVKKAGRRVGELLTLGLAGGGLTGGGLAGDGWGTNDNSLVVICC